MQGNLEFNVHEFDKGIEQLIDTVEAVNSAKELTRMYLEKREKGKSHPFYKDCSKERSQARKAIIVAHGYLRQYEQKQNKFTICLNGRFESLINEYNDTLENIPFERESAKKLMKISIDELYKK